MGTEREIKLKIENLDGMLQKFRNIGCFQVRDFAFEENSLYDFDDLSLKEKGKILRVRQYCGQCTLTLKEKTHEDPLYKVRSEFEVNINDQTVMKKILESLGMKVFYRYQKYRAHYMRGDLSIFVDRTPIGNFIELEGSEKEIDETAALLGYSKSDYLNISYLAYHLKYLKERGLPPSDMLFDSKE